jgi:hypothetical protein
MMDIITRLEQSASVKSDSPFMTILQAGILSNELYDLLVEHKLTYRYALQLTLWDTIAQLDGEFLHSMPLDALTSIRGISPLNARRFILLTRPPGDPIREQCVLLNHNHLDILRAIGVYVPNRVDNQAYSVLESMWNAYIGDYLEL